MICPAMISPSKGYSTAHHMSCIDRLRAVLRAPHVLPQRGRPSRWETTHNCRPRSRYAYRMSAEDLEKYETEMELSCTASTRTSSAVHVCGRDRTPFLPRQLVELAPRNTDGEVYFELRMSDAWVWDMYRPARFVKGPGDHVQDVNIEELEKPELRASRHALVARVSPAEFGDGP